MQTRKIAVAMSGGVDSSVAALRLVTQGEDVFGVMLRLWSAGPELENRCCSPRDLSNARAIAADLDIPFYVLDVKDKFKAEVVDTFIDGYAKGLTPNPCIYCNRNIRWGWLFERIRAMGATHLATGHYARSLPIGDHFQLLRAADRSKDQSYVLHVLTQEQLHRSLFPIGELQKAEVRAIAKGQGLNVADREDSQDLCFLGSMDYREFLNLHDFPMLEPGPIMNVKGEPIGKHMGLASYTIGQRKGIGISAEEPYYVIQKDTHNNTLVVGHRHELGRTTFSVGHVHWISGQAPNSGGSIQVQVRYKAKPVKAKMKVNLNGNTEVTLSEQIVDVTPGQWAVFYDDEVCLGGGMILP
jgi:tRNA-specific 2-thiouridylase